MEAIIVALSAVAGALAYSIISWLPGIHIYSIIALLTVCAVSTGIIIPEILIPFCTGLIAAYSVIGTVPSILLAAPDESAVFSVLPGLKYLRRGRGYEAIMLTSVGSLSGLIWICIIVGAAAPFFLGTIISVLRPHMHWIVWCVICFLLLSEWPREGRYTYDCGKRLAIAWEQLLAGLLTFALSGLLGMLLFFRNPINAANAFQSLMPAFAGLFTLPWLIITMLSKKDMPDQVFRIEHMGRGNIVSGGLAGILGGSFAAIMPAVTGGVGGFLAGHASSLRNDKAFLISQGASRTVYYLGSFILFFVPAMSITRGGGARMLMSIYTPSSSHDYFMVLASAAIGGGISFCLLHPVIRVTMFATSKIGNRYTSLTGIIITVTLAFLFTGCMGLLVMMTSLGIGMIPVLHGSRRMNCLGIILLPIAVLL